MLLVVYDISDDKRRRKLHDQLWEHGIAIQYSAFECPDAALPEVRRIVSRFVREGDRADVYRLCGRCASRALRFGDLPGGGRAAEQVLDVACA